MAFIQVLLLMGFLVAFGDEGVGLDPNGGAARIAADDGGYLDPNGGLRATTDEGNGFDPHG